MQSSDGKSSAKNSAPRPTVQKSIRRAFVVANYATEVTQLQADLKGTLNPATVVKLPFYKRST